MPWSLALLPGPHPAFRRLQCTASDGKLGEGLGEGLGREYFVYVYLIFIRVVCFFLTLFSYLLCCLVSSVTLLCLVIYIHICVLLQAYCTGPDWLVIMKWCNPIWATPPPNLDTYMYLQAKLSMHTAMGPSSETIWPNTRVHKNEWLE